GKSGGLFICWSNEVQVFSIIKHSFCMEVGFLDEKQNCLGWGIFIYASTDSHIRSNQWAYLEGARHKWGLHWFLGGDLNDILSEGDKKGGRKRSLSSFHHFRNFVSGMGMLEINMIGHPYTWGNNREGEGFVEEKLDRVFGSLAWNSAYPNAAVHNIFKSASDHSLLMLDFSQNQFYKKKRFIFDRRWLHRPGIKETVEKGWQYEQGGTPMYNFQQKIKKTRLDILKWSSTFRSENARRITQLNHQLSELRKAGHLIDWRKWDELKHELDAAYEQEEQHWAQKARVSWLKHGDKNSQYFHAKTLQRRRRNNIAKLTREDGGICETKEQIEACIENFYAKLFKSEGSENGERLLQGIEPVISQDMNSELTAPVEEDEIKAALFSINPKKSPGID
ncbi:Unknown protein, partial [Striga hermonthica]